MVFLFLCTFYPIAERVNFFLFVCRNSNFSFCMHLHSSTDGLVNDRQITMSLCGRGWPGVYQDLFPHLFGLIMTEMWSCM